MRVIKKTICIILTVGFIMSGYAGYLKSTPNMGSVDLKEAVISLKSFKGVADDHLVFRERIKRVIYTLRHVAGIETGIREHRSPDSVAANLFFKCPFLISTERFNPCNHFLSSVNEFILSFDSYLDTPEIPPPRQIVIRHDLKYSRFST